MEKLLWLDMEMTGLDVEKERIIEVAAIVTDKDLRELASYHSVVFQDQKFLDAMDDWNKNQHGKSGLIEKIPHAPKSEIVENEICAFVDKHFTEPAILAGNSIGQDRKFIDRYWIKFAEKLHYRMLDVTAWKMIMESRYNVVFKKSETHRALDDIKESIAELQCFYDFIDGKQTQ
ncbi:MAG: oligoribonuclease [Bdellovibrionales bacterium]|nr:oligoribonuclease [Bdellovibrionales bacterium]